MTQTVFADALHVEPVRRAAPAAWPEVVIHELTAILATADSNTLIWAGEPPGPQGRSPA